MKVTLLLVLIMVVLLFAAHQTPLFSGIFILGALAVAVLAVLTALGAGNTKQ